VTLGLTASYQEQGGGETSYQVSAGTLSNVQITETLPATVSSGGSFTGHLVADSGYSLPSSIVVSGTHGTVSYDQSTGVFTIPNITSNVAISATAVAPVSIKLVQGKYIAYQGTSPSTPSTPSLYTEVCCMTAPISVDFTNLGDGVDWNNCSVEWVHNNIYERGNISFIRSGGFNPDSVKAGEDATSNSYSSSTIVAGTWAARQSSVTGIIATFKYNPTTGKVAEGCRVVLKNGDTILRTLISESDLQNATFVTV
jgi:hypothetical protein